MPEVGVLSLSNEVLEDVLVRGSRVLGSGGGLSELGDKFELLGDAISEFAI